MEGLKRLFSRCSCFSPKDTDTSSPPKPAAKFKATNQTTLILSHGAFSTQFHYQPFLNAVQKNTCFSRTLFVQQSSSNANPPPNSFEADIELLHETIRRELTAGRDVLLVCHSYGGIPGCEALADLPEKAVEGKGKLGRVLGIVFVSAFIADAGQSLVTAQNVPAADWVKIDGTLSYAINAAEIVFSLLPAALSAPFVEKLVPQATASFLATTSHATWKDYPCVYVRDLEDKAMKLDEQDHFIARLKQGQSKTTVRDFEGDHVPLASRPEELAKVMEEVVGELRKGSD